MALYNYVKSLSKIKWSLFLVWPYSLLRFFHEYLNGKTTQGLFVRSLSFSQSLFAYHSPLPTLHPLPFYWMHGKSDGMGLGQFDSRYRGSQLSWSVSSTPSCPCLLDVFPPTNEKDRQLWFGLRESSKNRSYIVFFPHYLILKSLGKEQPSCGPV